MNKVFLIGRLTADPEVRYTAGENAMAIGTYTLAVDRRFKKEGDTQTADFLRCISFGKSAEFVKNYLHKGTKMVVEGRIQTGSYTNKDGVKVYTTDIIVENQEFAESKSAAQNSANATNANNGVTGTAMEDIMNAPEGVDEVELPF